MTHAPLTAAGLAPGAVRLVAAAHGSRHGRAAADWPQFRNTPTLTGVASSPLPATLRLLWTYDAGAAVESSAAIVDGVVYVGVVDRRAARARCWRPAR